MKSLRIKDFAVECDQSRPIIKSELRAGHAKWDYFKNYVTT